MVVATPVPELAALLRAGDLEALRLLCEETHPADLADELSQWETEEVWPLLKKLSWPIRAEIISHFDEDLQVDLLSTLKRRDMVLLFTEMPPDDRADLFKVLPEEAQEAVLPGLAQAERDDIRRLASYEEGTAGSVMTSDYATLPADITVEQAFEHLREVAPDRETIYYAYIVDARRKLLGFVSLKDLILARRGTRIRDIMHREVITTRVDVDQELAAREIQKYDLIALPVVSEDDILLGIITHDDALDVITQEQTEDVEKLMAIAGSHEAGSYLRSSPWVHFKNRVGWVVALAAVGLACGQIVIHFSDLLEHYTILAAFMTLLVAAGGNTGSQSATLIIRGLALKEVAPRDILRILFKELRISMMLGSVLAVLALSSVMLFQQRAELPVGATLLMVGLTIAIALGLQVVTATLIGALLPMAAAKLKLDPALVASPALTTAVDVTGLLLYFSIASRLLSL